MPFLVRLPSGVSGSGVYYIDNEESFSPLQKDLYSSIAIIEKFIDGISISIQGIISLSQVVFSAASMQIIGHPICTTKIFGWCGNDFYIDDHIPPELLAETYRLCGTLAHHMKTKGYIGIFGKDLLVDVNNRQVFIIEVNPRFQTSSMLLTELEYLNGAPSLLLEQHISAFNQTDQAIHPTLRTFTQKGSVIAV